MGDIKRRYIRNTIIAICLVITLLFTNINVKASNRSEYLDITLADIIITWYNASGVAIGSSELVNEIQSAYGNITIDDLIEADVFTTNSVVSDPGSQSEKDLIRELLGYGNLTAPSIIVRTNKLKEFLSGYPVSQNAEKALKAMFGYDTDGGLVSDTFCGLLGCVIGTVANIGKIGYNFTSEVVTEGRNFIENLWGYKTLKNVYDRFTSSDYFQGLFNGGSDEGPVFNGDLGMYDDWGFIQTNYPNNGDGYLFLLKTNSVPILYHDANNNVVGYTYNLTYSTYTYKRFKAKLTGGEIITTNSGTVSQLNSNSWHKWLSDSEANNISNGIALNKALVYFGNGMNTTQAKAYVRENNPWGESGTENPENPGLVQGVTNYINRTVGNILSDNYLNLSPNISNDDYMYIFTRDTYNNILNEITNNNNNNNYTENSTVINNYNNTYIQENAPQVRPTSAPADKEQPIQPFISPRPSPIPEEIESVIYEGGISEEITKKFPFCIPWDIKAMIDNLWSPQVRAPYIHWDATFGTYGKLGEVDIDFAPYDGVAAIFRSTTLLLWIVGLLVLTKNLLG